MTTYIEIGIEEDGKINAYDIQGIILSALAEHLITKFTIQLVYGQEE